MLLPIMSKLFMKTLLQFAVIFDTPYIHQHEDSFDVLLQFEDKDL